MNNQTTTTQHRAIYEIGNDIILTSFDEEGALDTERLDNLKMEFKEKAVRCIAFIKNRKFQEDMCDAEIKRLRAEIKAVEAQKKQYQGERTSVAEYLKNWLIKLGFKKIDRGIHKATVAKRPTSVVVYDESRIPANFMKAKTEYTPNKTAIKQHFQNTGEYVDGCEIIHDQTHLLIRFPKANEVEV